MNYTKDGLLRDLQSTDVATHTRALQELARWLLSDDPLKREFAAQQTSQAINKTVEQSEAASSQAQRKQILDTFWAAHEPQGLINNQANLNQLLTWVFNNSHNQLSLDTLEKAVEALGTNLARNTVAPPPLSALQTAQAKANAAKMRETYLRNLSVEDLKRAAREEEKAKRQGRDPLKQFELTEDEAAALASQPKPSATQARLWNLETSNPCREYTSLELRMLTAPEIRRLITNGGHQLDWEKQKRFNEILAGYEIETQAA